MGPLFVENKIKIVGKTKKTQNTPFSWASTHADSHAQALGECHAKYFTLGAAGARSKPCKA